MRNVLYLMICLTALATSGCASKWAMVVESPIETPSWRDDTNLPRVAQRESVTGFKETGASVSNALKHIVFGRKPEDNTILRPVAVAVGRDNRIAIVDQGRACVHLYIPSEQQYVRIFGAEKAELRSPVSVAFDDELNLYVSDSARSSIDVFGREGAYLFSINKAGEEALQRPTGLLYVSGKKILYAVDTLANKVYAFGSAGALLSSFGGPGEQTGQFNFPTHITAAPDGSLYVVDAMNFRVQVFDSAGRYRSSFGHHGNGSGDFAMPKGIAVDKGGVIYVVDTLFDNIQLFNASGGFLLTIGRRGTGPGEFSMPSGVYLDGRDKLYVCDTYNQRIQVFQLIGAEHE